MIRSRVGAKLSVKVSASYDQVISAASALQGKESLKGPFEVVGTWRCGC